MAWICNRNVEEMMTLEKLFASEDQSEISYVPKYFGRYKIIRNTILQKIYHFDTSKFILIEWEK